MRILYGVQGTGQGHISRARAMAKELARYPELDVTWLFTGRSKSRLFDMECFGDFEWRSGLTFASREGKLHYLDTLRTNNIPAFIRDVIQLDLSSYDLMISDYEPVTAWAAKLRGRECIGIGHQYAFDGSSPVAKANGLSKTIMRLFAPTTRSVGLHWYPFSQSICPPIIDLPETVPTTGNHVLVYLPFENQKTVTQWLQTHPEVEFRQYSPEVQSETLTNVTTCPTDYQGFKYDLANCKGVICNSGFELISECLQWGKPVLTFPMRGQMEQSSNALALDQLGLANVCDTLDPEALSAFLQNLRQQSSINFPNVAATLARWIRAGATDSPTSLAADLWRGVRISALNAPQEQTSKAVAA